MHPDERPPPKPSRFAGRRPKPAEPKPGRFAGRRPKPTETQPAEPKPAPPPFRAPRTPPPPQTSGDDLARDAIDWPRVSLEDIARGVATTRATMAAYRAGDRKMPAPVALKLARWMRAWAKEGERLAALLERAAQP